MKRIYDVDFKLQVAKMVVDDGLLNLKRERVWQRNYANHAEARQDINDYIVSFYNQTRLHSTLGYLPPNDYELKMADNPSHMSVQNN